MSTYYAQIPTEVLLSPTLTCFQKLLYADIQSLTNQKGYCFASNKYLSKRHNKDEKHISKQITTLINNNFLFLFERPTGRNSNIQRKLFTQSTFIQYAKINNIDIDEILNTKKNSVKNHTASGVKNHNHNNIKKKIKKKKRIINNSNESVDSYKQRDNVDQKSPILKKIKKNKKKQKLRKKKSFAAKLKKRKLQQQKTKKQKAVNKTKVKPKYKHTIKDLRNYNELLDHGITDHRSDKQKNNSIDKLHALFSSQCKDPYHTIDTPEIYVNFKWDMDLLIEVFEYHLKHTVKFNMKPVKSIGNFIFSEGYNGFKSWSPLVYWHQKMTKTAENELTEEGKKFLSSLKRAKVHGIMDIDSSIINKVAKETYYVANNHVFMDDKTITMSYPRGIIDTLSSYIKEQTNRDNFKLVYITKNGFIDEFLDIAKKRNIIKLKSNQRSVLADNVS